MSSTLAAAASALVVCTLLQLVLVPALRRSSTLDVPTDRSSHVVATPRGGGIGVLAGVVTGLALSGVDLGWSAPAGICLAALVGTVDDFRNLPPKARLAVQVAIGSLIVWPFGWPVAAAVLGGLAVVAYVNAFNFMDGVNGLSAVTATVCGAQFVVLGTGRDDLLVAVGAVTAAAALGFLPFNAPHARIFLGDVGSYGLGALLAWGFLLALSAGVPWPQVAAGAALYLADTGTTLIRRFIRGQDVFSAHREHTYQRLTQLGLPHITVSLLVGGVTVVLLAVLGVGWADGSSPLGLVVAAALVVGYLLLPTLLGGRVPAEARPT